MSKESKFIIAGFVATILIIASLAFIISGKEKTVAAIPNNPASGFEVKPASYDLGDVAINGGLVTKEYEVKNTSGKDVNLQKITTSCMCTVASVEAGGKTTKFFGMEMSGDLNPRVELSLKNGETAKVTVRFDPAAHGPAGLGQVDRTVWLYFDNGVQELSFKGNVIK